jgi:glycosyltransferase involved in cell wall biosynthesis
MQILFVHQNFPGQFKHLAPALAAKPGHTVVALTMRQIDSRQWQGVHIVRYAPKTGSQPGVHPWLRDFDTKVIRGEACFRAALQLREQGFQPDVIIAHPGWGESLFLKQVWPQARLGLYCEFYYLLQGGDIGFDPEFPTRDADGEACRVEMRNLNNAVHMPLADAAISPTHWQASTFPEPFRSRISVIHDGIDTELVAPDDSVALQLGELKLSRQDEVITFVNRNLEPCRGYHVFMRALPELLRRRPHARVLITGGDGVSYGAAPTNGQTWKQIYIDEAHAQHPDMDWSRVHFLGQIPYATVCGHAATEPCPPVSDLPLCAQLEPAGSHERRLRHCGQRHRALARGHPPRRNRRAGGLFRPGRAGRSHLPTAGRPSPARTPGGGRSRLCP